MSPNDVDSEVLLNKVHPPKLLSNYVVRPFFNLLGKTIVTAALSMRSVNPTMSVESGGGACDFALGSCYIDPTIDSAAIGAFLRNRLVWLLALVLLLPMAQTFAALHVISHAQAENVVPADGA